MDSIRINVLLPSKLIEEGQKLVKTGYYSNFSELIRDGLRKEIIAYKSGFIELTEKDRQLLAWARAEEKAGRILTERDMEKHGLRL